MLQQSQYNEFAGVTLHYNSSGRSFASFGAGLKTQAAWAVVDNARARATALFATPWYTTFAGLKGPDNRACIMLESTGKTRDWDMALYTWLSGTTALVKTARSILVGAAISRSGSIPVGMVNRNGSH